MGYTCRRIELGRHGSVPEVMIKWEGSPIPIPYSYFRTSSMVAYAEVCAPDDLLDSAWSAVTDCALKGGTAAGISTIVGGPTTALPIFQAAFKACLSAKIGAIAESIKVALSTSQQPNENWHR